MVVLGHVEDCLEKDVVALSDKTIRDSFDVLFIVTKVTMQKAPMYVLYQLLIFFQIVLSAEGSIALQSAQATRIDGFHFIYCGIYTFHIDILFDAISICYNCCYTA